MVQPNVNGSSITYQITSSFGDQGFCFLYGSPNWGCVRWKFSSSQSYLTLYLLWNSLIYKLSLLDATTDSSLAMRDLLISFAFLNPRPPALLRVHNLSQASQARYLSFRFLGFHQNFLDKVSKLSQILVGMSKVAIVQVGSACAIALIMVHLAAY